MCETRVIIKERRKIINRMCKVRVITRKRREINVRSNRMCMMRVFIKERGMLKEKVIGCIRRDWI